MFSWVIAYIVIVLKNRFRSAKIFFYYFKALNDADANKIFQLYLFFKYYSTMTQGKFPLFPQKKF